MALPNFYSPRDQDIYAGGNKFIPQEQYRLDPFTPPAIMGQNTNAGIVNTQAAGSYMGYPSYDAWLLAQGGGGGNGGVNEIEEDTFSMGMSPGALGGKLPGVGNWAKRTFGDVRHGLSSIPTPLNLLRKGIMKWKENRDARRAEELAASKAGKDAADAAAIGEGTNIGGGWTQTNTGGGGAIFAGPGGTTHEGWSNTPEGYGAAAASEGSFAQGGRIGYREGELVDENIKGPGFDENLMAGFIDPHDALNDMSMEIFNGRQLHELTPEEYQLLIDMANDQAMGEQDQGIASLV